MKRVASFLASGTEIVCALGRESAIVGISHECDWPPQVLDRPRLSAPRFTPAGLDSEAIDRAVRDAMAEHGSVYVVDEQRLANLAPDVVITQAVCDVCAVPTPGVQKIVQQRGLGAQVLSLDAHTIADILASIEQVGAALDAEDEAADVIAAIDARIQRVAAAVQDRPPLRVLALEWLDPPFAPGHWVPEMIEVAGGVNLLGATGAHSTQVSWQDLEGMDPDALIIMPCGYGLEASLADADAKRAQLQAIAPRALDEGRTWAVDGSSYFNRSGPRFVTGIEILAGLLHPDVFDRPAADVAAAWPVVR